METVKERESGDRTRQHRREKREIAREKDFSGGFSPENVATVLYSPFRSLLELTGAPTIRRSKPNSIPTKLTKSDPFHV